MAFGLSNGLPGRPTHTGSSLATYSGGFTSGGRTYGPSLFTEDLTQWQSPGVVFGEGVANRVEEAPAVVDMFGDIPLYNIIDNRTNNFEGLGSPTSWVWNTGEQYSLRCIWVPSLSSSTADANIPAYFANAAASQLYVGQITASNQTWNTLVSGANFSIADQFVTDLGDGYFLLETIAQNDGGAMNVFLTPLGSGGTQSATGNMVFGDVEVRQVL